VKSGMIAPLLALLAVLPASAQEADPEQRIRAALDRAAAAGTPVDLLELKAAEGRAKGASMDRIAAAVERRAAGLARAAAALSIAGRPPVEAEELSAGADALQLGVSDAVLRAIAEQAPQEHRFVAIAALTELVAQGRAPQEALDRVLSALTPAPGRLEQLPAGGRGRESGGAEPQARRGPPDGVPAPGQRPGRRD
jgi:hypothetical protein